MRHRGFFTAVAATMVVALVGTVVYRATESTRTAALAYVAVAANNHVLVVDLASGRRLRKIYAGAAPWRLQPSPDRRRLWVQHWFAGSTAVVDLDDHEIVGVVPSRGPGTFTVDGDRFVSFDWPSSALRSYDSQSLDVVREQVTEVREVYDVAADPGGSRLYLAQFDPMAQKPRERYGYVVAYPYREDDPARAVPVSYRTGRSPAAVRTVAGGAFVLTADRETNGLSLINRLGDGRSIPACAAPQTILIAPGENRMVVACWRGAGTAKSHVVSYRTDFAARPWPVITQEASVEVAGGLVAGTFSPNGSRLYLVDRTGGRLLECDPETLHTEREVRVGDEPMDVVVLDRPARVRDRLATEDGRARKLLKSALLPGDGARSAEVLTWIETTRWTKPPPRGDAAEGELAVERAAQRVRSYLRAPDSWRTESGDGRVRLAVGGHTVSVDPSGRFWVAPRQNLIATVLALPVLSREDAVRQLAGDVPGSPFLRGGLAVDVVREVGEGEARSLLVGAAKAGDRAAQLVIDLTSGNPSSLVEQFPLFESRGHRPSAIGGLVHTRLHAFADLGGRRFPSRLERVLDGRWTQEVGIEAVESRRDFPTEKFDLTRLGGLPIPSSLAGTRYGGGTDRGSGRAVPVLLSGYVTSPGEPHSPYLTNPPTSGPRLRSIADWGVHRVPIPPELQVHNLEHGGVVIQYNCPSGCRDWVERLEALVRGRDFLLLAPYPWMEARIALTAWGRLETLEDLDVERVRRFVDAHAGRDHHAATEPSSGVR